jgi:hypothetical protein
MRTRRIILSTIGILFGASIFVYGGYDDSPGAQLLGFVLVILGIVGIVKSKSRLLTQEKLGITNEFSFILQPSEHGVGVFTTQKIPAGTYLRLFGDERELGSRSLVRKTADVPKAFQSFCMHRGETMVCPQDFGSMSVGWYLNHSTQPNAVHRNFHWYAARDIKQGDEILIDYNTLEEPEDAKEKYYRKST